jgi:hypothetical protein
MPMYPEIRRFVQEKLGCSCPEEVFNTIDYQKGSDDLAGVINVGDRLLIYIITMDRHSGIQGEIDSALKQGVEERDRKGFNRFRLVLVAPPSDELCRSAEQAFERSVYTDDKTHLHIVNKMEVSGFLG